MSKTFPQIVFDIKNLKKRTQDAIKKGQEEQKRKQKEQQDKQEAFEKEEQRKAKSILAKLPAKCEQAASEGKNSVTVMKLEYGDYDANIEYFDNKKGLIEKLNLIKSLKAQIVFQECCKIFNEDSGGEVKIEHWHDGIGMNGGYELNVYW